MVEGKRAVQLAIPGALTKMNDKYVPAFEKHRTKRKKDAEYIKSKKGNKKDNKLVKERQEIDDMMELFVLAIRFRKTEYDHDLKLLPNLSSKKAAKEKKRLDKNHDVIVTMQKELKKVRLELYSPGVTDEEEKKAAADQAAEKAAAAAKKAAAKKAAADKAAAAAAAEKAAVQALKAAARRALKAAADQAAADQASADLQALKAAEAAAAEAAACFECEEAHCGTGREPPCHSHLPDLMLVSARGASVKTKHDHDATEASTCDTENLCTRETHHDSSLVPDERNATLKDEEPEEAPTMNSPNTDAEALALAIEQHILYGSESLDPALAEDGPEVTEEEKKAAAEQAAADKAAADKAAADEEARGIFYRRNTELYAGALKRVTGRDA